MQHHVRPGGGRVDSLTDHVALAAEFSQAAGGVQLWDCGCHIICAQYGDITRLKPQLPGPRDILDKHHGRMVRADRRRAERDSPCLSAGRAQPPARGVDSTSWPWPTDSSDVQGPVMQKGEVPGAQLRATLRWDGQ